MREGEKQGMPVSRGRHTRGADVDVGAKLSGLKCPSFRGAHGAHWEVAQGEERRNPQTQPRLWSEVIVWHVLEEKCSEETQWRN